MNAAGKVCMRHNGIISWRIDLSYVMTTFLDRITIDPEQCGGRPCIRGMRIRVSDVLDLFAAGLSAGDILAEMPDLLAEDLQACLTFASRRIDHPMLAAS
jgi:uncharacterized protein (DUF433 family)